MVVEERTVDAAPAGRPGPHLVMVSGSHVQFDARVRKSAATAAAAGYRVSVVAPSPTGARADVDAGGWRQVDVPVGRRLRDRATRSRTLGRLGYRDEDQARAARDRLTAVESRVAATGPALRARRWVVARRTVVMRYRQQRRIYAEPWARPVVDLALRVPALSGWRRLFPEALDLDAAFGPVIDELAPDLLQSHDVQTVAVVAAAAERAAAAGRRVPWIYDAHEHIAGLTTYPPDRLAGLIDLEASFIRGADAVLTVCDPIADSLQARFDLPERPTVVLNAPPLPLDLVPDLTDSPDAGRTAPDAGAADPSSALTPSAVTAPPRSLHADAGLDPDVPVVVYSGKVDADRGIDDLAGALPHLRGDVHVVLITNRAAGDSYLARIRSRLARHGCADRLHTVPYVASDQLVGYLSEAAIGFAGFSHIGNHEVSLPNKFFDYLHAGVPMVVTDLQLLGPLVRRLGVGRVYPFGDARALASVIEWMLREPERYRAALADPQLRRTYSWQAQEPALLRVYARLAPLPRAAAGAR
jgi:glycosyltransferase involved in cell wall biosynthesis